MLFTEPKNTKTKALNLVALQQDCHNAIHSPLLYVKRKDEECKKRQCCPGKEGCYLSNRKEDERQSRKCGCRKPLDDKCSFSAPYAILANSECGAKEKTEITACLRERREGEYLPMVRFYIDLFIFKF